MYISEMAKFNFKIKKSVISRVDNRRLKVSVPLISGRLSYLLTSNFTSYSSGIRALREDISRS